MMKDRVQQKRKASIWILVVAIGVLALKSLAYTLAPSAALLSDALETIVNVLAGVVTLVVIRFVSQPADLEHPYGHGKAEFVSAAFEGGLVFAAALLTVVEAIRSYYHPYSLQNLDAGLLVSVLAASINLVLGLYLKKVASEEKSEAIGASSLHLLSDVYTTLGVLAGLLLVRLTGWTVLDSVIAAIVGVVLMRESYTLIRGAVAGLIDERRDEVLAALVPTLERHRFAGEVEIHQLRVIRSGDFHHIDAHIVLPRFWSLDRVHAETEKYEAQVLNDYEFDGEIAFHVDPCKDSHCANCGLPECPIRKSAFVGLKRFQLGKLIMPPQTELTSR